MSIKITNRGNTVHATGADAQALFDAITKQRAKHIHVNNGTNDACNDCGMDLRDEIHVRMATNIPTTPGTLMSGTAGNDL